MQYIQHPYESTFWANAKLTQGWVSVKVDNTVFLITASLFITCNQSNISFDNKLLDYEIPDDSIINIFIEPYTKQIIDSDLNTPLSYSPVKYTKKDGS